MLLSDATSRVGVRYTVALSSITRPHYCSISIFSAYDLDVMSLCAQSQIDMISEEWCFSQNYLCSELTFNNHQPSFICRNHSSGLLQSTGFPDFNVCRRVSFLQGCILFLCRCRTFHGQPIRLAKPFECTQRLQRRQFLQAMHALLLRVFSSLP